jgi:hypothetical protein
MHHATTHGRYSKDAPVALAEKFQRELEDTGGDGLIQEIGLCRAFIREMLGTDPVALDNATRNRILSTIDRLAKLVETHRKFEMSQVRTLSFKQAALFLTSLQRSIVDEVRDPALVQRIAKRHKELMHVSGVPQRQRPELIEVQEPERPEQPEEDEEAAWREKRKMKELRLQKHEAFTEGESQD